MDSFARMVDECWPWLTPLCALVGDDYPMGLVDDYGLCEGRLSPAFCQRFCALLGVDRIARCYTMSSFVYII